MTEITKPARYRHDDRHQVRYILSGERGAIEFHSVYRPIAARPFFEYHSSRPHWDGQVPEPWPCIILGWPDHVVSPCYSAGSPSREASDLAVNYTVSGGDDRLIWAELERRYTAWEAEVGR